MVNLVGVTMLREMGPLLAAIIVAGRTGSAYTAQIGTMHLTEELDALRSIGTDTLALAPRVSIPLAVPAGSTLQVVMPTAAPGYGTSAMAYRPSAHELRYYARQRWIDQPARLLGRHWWMACRRAGHGWWCNRRVGRRTRNRWMACRRAGRGWWPKAAARGPITGC